MRKPAHGLAEDFRIPVPLFSSRHPFMAMAVVAGRIMSLNRRRTVEVDSRIPRQKPAASPRGIELRRRTGRAGRHQRRHRVVSGSTHHRAGCAEARGGHSRVFGCAECLAHHHELRPAVDTPEGGQRGVRRAGLWICAWYAFRANVATGCRVLKGTRG